MHCKRVNQIQQKCLLHKVIETAKVQLNQHQTAQDLLNAKKKRSQVVLYEGWSSILSAGNFVAFRKFGPCFYKFLNHISQLKLISYEISKIRLFGSTILETK